MVDETTGGKPLFCKVFLPEYAEPAVLVSTANLTELIAAAEECAEAMDAATKKKFKNMVPYPGKMGDETRELAPVRRLRAAVARVRGE